MSEMLPKCLSCESEYVYQDQSMLICPECNFEWNPDEPDEDELIVKDIHGNKISRRR